MKNELIKVWYAIEKPTLEEDTDSYIQIELIFNWLLSHGMSSKYALKNFHEFVDKNKNMMSKSLKQTIFLYAQELAAKIYPNDSSIKIIDTIHQLLFAPNNIVVKK